MKEIRRKPYLLWHSVRLKGLDIGQWKIKHSLYHILFLKILVLLHPTKKNTNLLDFRYILLHNQFLNTQSYETFYKY